MPKHLRHHRVLALAGGWLWCADCGAIKPDAGTDPRPWLLPGTHDLIAPDIVARWKRPAGTSAWPKKTVRGAAKLSHERRVEGVRMAPVPGVRDDG